jgi:hypothetical protein
LAALAELEQRRGANGRAAALRAQASAIVERLADSLADNDLRHSLRRAGGL